VEQLPSSPTDARLALSEGALVLGVPVSTHVAARMLFYLEELMRWNARMNLTATDNKVEIISRHFLDSLAAFKIFQPRPGIRILDIGTGAGFPGLVWKLHAPNLAVTLVESATKKAAFLHHISGLLGTSGLEIIIKRIQDFQEQKPFQLITSRALQTNVLLSAAPRFLAAGGRVLLHRVRPLEEDPQGYVIDRQFSYRLPFLDIPRTIALLRLSDDASPSALQRPLTIL
jgi:16S rRNA (guanine527-N7)-methyltransferase